MRIPFAADLLAERLRSSGILAAVAACITMNYLEQSWQALAITRVRRTEVWQMIQFSTKWRRFRASGRAASKDRRGRG
jgi:NhaP-type Na+/H+ or K+/H+ antiporter